MTALLSVQYLSKKFLLQFPLPPWAAIGIKLLALTLVSLLTLVPLVSAIVLWTRAGGHLYGPEIFSLLSGYALYGWAVAGIAFFCAAICDSTANAAIAAVSLTLLSWVVDFTKGSSALSRATFLSLTAALRPFERGLVSLPEASSLFLAGLGFLLLAAIALSTRRTSIKLRNGALVLLFVGASGWFLHHQIHRYADCSEDHRNSFQPEDVQALAAMNQMLKITVHLSPEDSRFKDFDANLLQKLKRTIPRIDIRLAQETRELAAPEDPDYGWIDYDYAGKTQRSTSNSEEEVLSILYQISGQKTPSESENPYPGHPLAVSDVGGMENWFYVGLPILLAIGYFKRRII